MGIVNLGEWIDEHGLITENLEPDEELDDLEPLREVIGDARVVAIGENAHHVREFYLLRHRLLRFMVERCGFSVYAFETSVLESTDTDAWVQGGTGVIDGIVPATGTELARCQEMYRTLGWLREHNETTTHPIRFSGTLAGSGGGSPLGELSELESYARRHDTAALPPLRVAADIAATYADEVSIVKTLTGYSNLDAAARDGLTAAISRLLFLLMAQGPYQRGAGHGRDHAWALAALRRVWRLDNFTRDVTGYGTTVGSTGLDAAMAQTVLEKLDEHGPDTRIVLGLHNVHIGRVPGGGPAGPHSAGCHLSSALGTDYVAIAATSGRGVTVSGEMDGNHRTGFAVTETPLPQAPADAIESAFSTDHALTVVDLRGARTAVSDVARFTKLRMLGEFTDVRVFDAYDAVAHVSDSTPTDYVQNRA